MNDTKLQINPFQPSDRRPAPNRIQTEVWIFDLDNTLYPAHCNLFAQVDERIGDFIADYLDLDPIAARKMQKNYFRNYGTTLNGLMQNHAIKPEKFLDYVHDIDVTILPKNPELDNALATLAGRKLIYTNGSKNHAENVINQLGITQHFDAIYDIITANYRPKPDPAPYQDLIKHHDIDPTNAVMIEDMAGNLAPAEALGMTTVWLKNQCEWAQGSNEEGYVHHIVDDLVQWLLALPGKEVC